MPLTRECASGVIGKTGNGRESGDDQVKVSVTLTGDIGTGESELQSDEPNLISGGGASGPRGGGFTHTPNTSQLQPSHTSPGP